MFNFYILCYNNYSDNYGLNIMEILEFLDTKDVMTNIEQKIKEDVNSKQHRNLLKKIIKTNFNDSVFVDYILKGYNDFLENKTLMKNNNIIFENYFKDERRLLIKSFEAFNDDVQKSILKNNANKLKKRILSKKYEYLCDDESEKLFLEMASMEFTREELQNFVGKKISAFHHPIEFNGALMNLIDIKSCWEPHKIISKLNAHCEKDKDYSISYQKDNKMVIDIHSFEASKLIGSKMWCITREKAMYKHYKEDQHIDYKFLLDFNKDASDDLSMIAFLTSLDGTIESFYSKDDTELSDNFELKKGYEVTLDSLYKNKYTFTDMISRLQKNTEYEDNLILNKKFNPMDEDHIWVLLQNVNDLKKVVSKSEMEKRPDLFDVSEMKQDDFCILRDVNLKEYLERECEYTNELTKFLEKKNYDNATIQMFFEKPELKKLFVDSWEGYSNYLLNARKYDEFLEFLQDEDFIEGF